MTGLSKLALTVPWLLTACGEPSGVERDQWIVSIETDAPVPELGDRLLIEVFPGGDTCDGCTRHLAAGDPREWPVSFGVLPADDVSVQVTLFRAALIRQNGLPDGDALLQARARLPETSGPTRVSIELRMDCFGVRASAADRTTCDPGTRTLVPEPEAPVTSDSLVVGSWPQAQSTPCGSRALPGTVCIPGGLFLLGDAAAHLIADVEEQPVPERLVQLSPFFMDEHELTVGEARALIDLDPTLSLRQLGGCTYVGQRNAGNDDLPLNCITRPEAEALCGALGKRLPNEAEWEYAAGNRERETPFPWGHDEDVCAHAVVARAPDISKCRASPSGTLPPGLQAVGTLDDTNSLGVRDLGGNLSEWLQDGFRPYEAECWQTPSAALTDPVCAAGDSNAAVRGGSWMLRPSSARVASRSSSQAAFRSADVGVRCVSSP